MPAYSKLESHYYADPRERQPGLLTYDMREFVLGEKVLEGQAFNQARQRLRDRIRNGLADFEYLYLLSDNDRHTIFSGLEDTPWPDEDADPGMMAMGRGIEHLFGFLYDGVGRRSPASFESYLRNGIEGMHPRTSDRGHLIPDASVNIDVSWHLRPDPKIARERLRNGEELDEQDIGVLVKYAELTDEDWRRIQDQNMSELPD